MPASGKIFRTHAVSCKHSQGQIAAVGFQKRLLKAFIELVGNFIEARKKLKF
jgi:hypothetical protein